MLAQGGLDARVGVCILSSACFALGDVSSEMPNRYFRGPIGPRMQTFGEYYEAAAGLFLAGQDRLFRDVQHAGLLHPAPPGPWP